MPVRNAVETPTIEIVANDTKSAACGHKMPHSGRVQQYFFDRVQNTVKAGVAGSRFIAIADPGSKLQQVAQANRFRHIFYGLPSIGGRYSVIYRRPECGNSQGDDRQRSIPGWLSPRSSRSLDRTSIQQRLKF